MDYEQKYKQALKKGQELYKVMRIKSSTDALNTVTALEEIFPELKESDNELRRALHIIQNSFYGGTYVSTKAMELVSKINVYDKTKSVKDIIKQFEEALTNE